MGAVIMPNLLMFMGVGPMELFVILLIALLLFGGKKLPEVARGLGKGMHEFKKAKEGLEEGIKKELVDEEQKSAKAEKPSDQADA